MELFLMSLCLSVLGLAVAAIAFGAATRPEQPAPETKIQPELDLRLPAHFFTTMDADSPAPRPRVPIEALLLQIESHVRMEHAAAESFVASPNANLLHSRTTSPLVN